MQYRPQCNGQCEHFNSTLISMIGALSMEFKIKWQEQLPPLVHAYKVMYGSASAILLRFV